MSLFGYVNDFGKNWSIFCLYFRELIQEMTISSSSFQSIAFFFNLNFQLFRKGKIITLTLTLAGGLYEILESTANLSLLALFHLKTDLRI